MTADPSPSAESLEERLRRRERELRAVYRITSALHARTGLDELERQTLNTAIETVDASVGSILLFDPKKERLVFRYVVNPDPAVVQHLMTIELAPGQGISGAVYQEGRGRISVDAAASAQTQQVSIKTGYDVQNLVTVPLKTTEGETIGVMQICNKREGIFDADDLEVLEILAIHAASAIETASLRQEAEKAIIVNLIGDISHDVKNLITPVVGGTQTLELMLKSSFESLDAVLAERHSEQELAEAVRQAMDDVRSFFPEAVEMTYEGAQNVQERVREIADAVKGVIGEPYFELAALQEVAESVGRPLRLLAAQKSIRIDLSGVADAPPVEMDKKRIYNALYNLINNAIPETPEGGTISVSAREVELDGGDWLEIDVQDTGRGMPAHVRERLFSREGAVSTKVGGTGLGTRIVKNVIDAHHGTITVDSEPQKGTRFRIRIPVRQNGAAG